MEVPKRLKSVKAIQENSIDDVTEMMMTVDFVHYRQITPGVKAFEQVKNIEISMLEVTQLLEDIDNKKDGYIINQLFGPKKLAVEDDKQTMTGLILAAKYPEVSERIVELTMIESVDAKFKFIVKVKHYGQVFTWEIIEQVSRDKVSVTGQGKVAI